MNAPSTTPPIAGDQLPAAVTELRVDGMTCNNCARHVTEAIQSVSGVCSATVTLEARHAAVRWTNNPPANVAAVISAIRSAGYDAKVIEPAAQAAGRRPQSGWHFNLWLGGVVTLLLMLGEWAFNLGMTRGFQWLAFVLAGAVQVFAGAQFYRGAWRQLKIGSANMDTLVALGSTTAFAYSAWALVSAAGGHVYFMEAAAIITLISVGHWIEARVSARASGALESLLQLAPQTARRIQKLEAGRFDIRKLSFSNSPTFKLQTPIEEEVPVAALRIGDRVVLRPGDRVPVDGVVVEGDSAVDEAMLSGESVPVDKSPRSELYAGTVNMNGRLVMRVTATGEATALAHIIAAVQRAQTSRARIQRLGDRVSNVFVPLVVAIALGAGIWWGFAPETAMHIHAWLGQFLWPAHPPTGAAAGFIIAAAVLIIACPCAMGLATPAAIMASANAAARRGILIRDAVALEKAGKITAIAFDKTGTLTEGKPKVTAAKSYPAELTAELASSQIETLAASLAAMSGHPSSRAVAAVASTRLPLDKFNELPGRGVTALFADGHFLQLGSMQWLAAEKVDGEAASAFADEWMSKGATVIGFAVDSRLVAAYALEDSLKAAAEKTIHYLANPAYLSDGCKIYLLSGDSSRTVHAIANKLDIPLSRTAAEIRPEQKVEFIKKLQAAGERVAFVGDGINDAPALTQADLGIAVSRASDVAREAADIILLKSEIEAVPEALGLARATLRTIKQNLFWAFFYNALGVPLAALGFMSPVLCAAAMGVSDLIVIGNALRLRRWRLRTDR